MVQQVQSDSLAAYRSPPALYNPRQSSIGAKPIQGFDPGIRYNSLGESLGSNYMESAGLKPGNTGFNFTDAMGNFSLGAQGVMGLAGAYNAYKQLGLQEDQFDFQKSLANRNIANQALTTNRMLKDRADMAAQMTTGAEYGTPEHLAAREKLTTTVSGAPIG